MLKAYGIRPRRRFGQHFLVSRRVLDRILGAAAPTPQDGVLEIGAGIGTLTVPLAEASGAVVAVELDRDLLPALRDAVARFPHVRLVAGDVMAMDLDRLVASLPHPRKAVSNLPYQIAAPLIVALLERPRGFARMVFTVQREVAARLTASAGGKDYGALSVAVQYRAEPSVVMRVPATAFFPPPDVESAVVQLAVRPQPAVQVADEVLFFRVVRAAFAHRRKTLRNTLAHALALDPSAVAAASGRAGIDPARRGETLTLGEFASLTAQLAPDLAQR